MNDERYILFENYLSNELSAEEKTNFEKQLAEDSELASAFEIFKDLNIFWGNFHELNRNRSQFFHICNCLFFYLPIHLIKK